jgi:hypothetical protein
MKTETSKLLIKHVLLRCRVSLERLFKLSFDYAEERVTKKQMVQIFLDYEYFGTLPEAVEDYCLHLLAKH